MQAVSANNAQTRIVAAGQPVAEALAHYRGKEGNWHPMLLITLAGELMLNGKELIQSQQEQNPSRTAWAARNSMELYFWVKYAAESPENARRFHEDMLCDFRDMLKKFGNEPALASQVTEGTAALHSAMLVAETIGGEDRFLPVAEMAKRYGEDGEFGIVNKFLSKFVHPTSLGVQLRTTPVFASLIGPTILELGVMFIERACPILAGALTQAEGI